MDSKVLKILNKFDKKKEQPKLKKERKKKEKRTQTKKSTVLIDGLLRSKSKNISYYAIEWLEFIRASTGENILHSLNGGEVVIEDPELKTKTGQFKKYYADGFCKESNTVYEFNGSFVHGQLKTEKDKKNKLLVQKNKKTMERENRLKELGYSVISMWADDWKNSQERLEFLMVQGMA